MPPNQNTDRTTVYTIYAGMIPTLGFEAGDFTVERAGNIGRNAWRGKTLSLGTSISERGRQRKARVRGSVAWYEYSTTVRAIHEEILGGDETGSDAHEVLRWPTDWKAMFQTGNRGLAEAFANAMDPDILAPTGEEYAGGRGQPSEQETDVEGVTITHPDDDLERQQGRLINRANSVDIYVEGRDGHIYRLDVTSMGMDASRAHHGLDSLAEREAAGVDSASLMSLIDTGPGGIVQAEARLLDYFQGRTEEYNNVIQGLKEHIHQVSGGRDTWLTNLDLENQQALDRIQRQITMRIGNLSTHDRRQMENLRPDLRTAIQRLERQGRARTTASGVDAGFKSAVQFALHALGTILQSRSTITEYRITAPNAPVPYTIGVQHRMHSSGQQVLEFIDLKQEDVRIRNEAALENHYLRIELQRQGVQNIDDILRQNAIDRNYMDSAYMVTQDNTAVEVGTVANATINDMARDGHNIHLGAKAIMSSRDFNESIDNWIRTVGSGRGWKGRVHNFLRSHLRQGPMVTHPDDTGNQRSRYRQIASPVRTGTSGDQFAGTGGLNAFNMLAHGRYGNEAMELDITSSLRGDFNLLSEMNYTVPHSGIQSRASRSDIAMNLLRGAYVDTGAQTGVYSGGGNSDEEWNHLLQQFSSKSKDIPQFHPNTGNPIPYYASDNNAGIRSMGMSMYKGIVEQRRTGIDSDGMRVGPARPGTLAGDRRKYWDLGEYLSDDQRDGFDDNVNPHWWAAPYISLYYPSGQVGSR